MSLSLCFTTHNPFFSPCILLTPHKKKGKCNSSNAKWHGEWPIGVQGVIAQYLPFLFFSKYKKTLPAKKIQDKSLCMYIYLSSSHVKSISILHFYLSPQIYKNNNKLSFCSTFFSLLMLCSSSADTTYWTSSTLLHTVILLEIESRCLHNISSTVQGYKKKNKSWFRDVTWLEWVSGWAV